jgi:hypothetical protein
MKPDLRLWSIWIFGLLMIPALAGLAGWRPNEIPETPSPSPGWAPSRFLDQDYYRELDTWIEERSATRGAGLWTRFEIDYELFGDSTTPLVAIGDDGWLFSRSWLDVPCESLDAIRRPDVPPVSDGVFTYLVPLAKAYWLSDLLAPHDRPNGCTAAARENLRVRLGDDPDWFDVNAAIDDDPAGSFYRRDPHWNSRGRVRVAEALVERFAPGLWDPDAVVAGEESVIPGMDRFLGLGARRTFADFTIERDVSFEVEQQSFGLGLLIWQRSTAKGDVIPGTTYIFGDSQMASVVPYIDQYFEELVFVGWLRSSLGPLPLDDLPSPDRLVVEALDQWADRTFLDPVIAQVAERLPGTGS